LKIRTLVKDAYNKFLGKYDFILAPISPEPAREIGKNTADIVTSYMGDRFTSPVNLAGLPAIAAPCGLDKSGIPVGIQLIGKAFSEPELVNTMRTYIYELDLLGN
ncbi:MAG: amidase family protein, partial [Oscillospiraceae bacterium]|nr:amidase family protein [Oscillospiraceae bacterium]